MSKKSLFFDLFFLYKKASDTAAYGSDSIRQSYKSTHIV